MLISPQEFGEETFAQLAVGLQRLTYSPKRGANKFWIELLIFVNIWCYRKVYCLPIENKNLTRKISNTSVLSILFP